jgi:alkaline phosphatase
MSQRSTVRCAAAIAAAAALAAPCAFAAPKQARNIILFIGDGMGVAQVQAGAFAAKGMALDAKMEPPHFSFERFPICGYLTSFSSDSFVTDSSAAGTALASGVKTKNGMLGVGPDGKPVETIAEMAKKRGMAVGVLSSVGLNHATPACFYAHADSRGDYDDITSQALDCTTVDVLMGGGIYRKTWTDDKLRAKAAEKGYKFFACDSIADLTPEKVGSSRVFGTFDTNDNKQLDYQTSRTAGCEEPQLSELTTRALALLSRNAKGFFLMVESGSIDWACHANDAAAVIGEVQELDRTVDATVAFLQSKRLLGDTLIIVTADHETGGLTLPGPYKKTLKPGQAPDIRFSVKDHTGITVPLWAQGPGGSALQGKNDNTAVFRAMEAALRKGR